MSLHHWAYRRQYARATRGHTDEVSHRRQTATTTTTTRPQPQPHPNIAAAAIASKQNQKSLRHWAYININKSTIYRAHILTELTRGRPTCREYDRSRVWRRSREILYRKKNTSSFLFLVYHSGSCHSLSFYCTSIVYRNRAQ